MIRLSATESRQTTFKWFCLTWPLNGYKIVFVLLRPTSEHHCVTCIVLLLQLECQGFVSEGSLGYVVGASCRYGKCFRAPEREAYSNLY